MSLTKMCTEDAPPARADDRLALYKQQTEKRRKEDLLRENIVLTVSKKYPNVLYYNNMFYSAVC